MKQLGGRLREVMDRLELTDMHSIQKHLVPKLDARETKFFPWRKTTKRGTRQVIDVREVEALSTQIRALDMAFKLRGDYAPKEIDTDPGLVRSAEGDQCQCCLA